MINLDSVLKSFSRQHELANETRAAIANQDPAAVSSWPFFDVEYDLSTTGPFLLGQERIMLGVPGYQLLYLKEGSSPGGRLNIDNGSTLQTVGPGSVIRAPFSSLSVTRSMRSAVKGLARLRIVRTQDAEFREPANYLDTAPHGARLLGNVTTATYVTVAENTLPDTGPAAIWDIFGWKKIRVWISGGATFESLEFIPWIALMDSAGDLQWYENGAGGPIVVPAPPGGAAAGTAQRVVTIDLVRMDIAQGLGHVGLYVNQRSEVYMYLEVRNLLPAALTGVGIAVEGVE